MLDACVTDACSPSLLLKAGFGKAIIPPILDMNDMSVNENKYLPLGLYFHITVISCTLDDHQKLVIYW